MIAALLGEDRRNDVRTNRREARQKPLAKARRRKGDRVQVRKQDPETGKVTWEIVGLGLPAVPECGPYDTRTEARRDERGMRRTLEELGVGSGESGAETDER